MTESTDRPSARDYWGRENQERGIIDALMSAGKDLDALTIDDLAPFDQFHTGGKRSTVRLAKLAGLRPGMSVLDVGGGLGGPARTLAVEFGCNVTVFDLTVSYVTAGEALTQRLGLEDRVRHRVGDALDLPFDDAGFDVVWTQNACMNISDKEQLYAGFRRALRPGGLLAFQEPLAGTVQPLIFPVMWADDASSSFLRSVEETRSLIEGAGFRLRDWVDLTQEYVRRSPPSRNSIQYLVMGEHAESLSLNGQRNEAEGRLVNVQAVFERL
jgi:ubiquinone/menaquinone biosynthesis C-methylase UbiE